MELKVENKGVIYTLKNTGKYKYNAQIHTSVNDGGFFYCGNGRFCATMKEAIHFCKEFGCNTVAFKERTDSPETNMKNVALRYSSDELEEEANTLEEYGEYIHSDLIMYSPQELRRIAEIARDHEFSEPLRRGN